jgi:tetratricopeptide (TPR) repeat protein
MFLHLNGEADTLGALQVLGEGIRMAPPSNDWLEWQGLMRLFPNEYQGMLRVVHLGNSAVDSASYYRAWAETYLALGSEQPLRAYSDSLRMVLESRIARIEEENQFTFAPHMFLGFAYAALGRASDAIREGQLACSLRPHTQHAYIGLQSVYWLATIYTMVGEYEKAMDELETLVSHPTWHSANVARIDPTWDPLRDHPRFQALLEQYGN